MQATKKMAVMGVVSVASSNVTPFGFCMVAFGFGMAPIENGANCSTCRVGQQ